MAGIAPGHERAYRAYRDEVEGDRLVRSSRTTALVVIVLSSSFIALDWLAYPQLFERFLAVRLGLDAILAAIYLRFARTHPVPSALVGCLAIGAAMLAVIEGSGGLLGEYYVGLVLLFVGMPVFMPYSARQAAGLVGILLVALAAPPLFEAGLDWRQYLLHLFFPSAAAVECVASCAALDRARFREFRRRRELEEARDQLAQLDLAKSRFTANVHHELRTPLTLMLAPLDAMLEGEFGVVPDLQRDYLKTMHSNARRLLKLINNLLDLAKIEGEQLTITRVPTRVGELMGDLIVGARPLAERKGVALEGRGLEELPQVNVDPEALEKIVVNLVGNALKFTDRGGRIELHGEARGDAGVECVVADTGAGIAADQIGRIFDRFAQVDGSGTRRHEGTGIGLSLVKELVDLHGGSVWAESEGIGHGTQVHVILPQGQPDAASDEDVLESTQGEIVSLGNSIAAMEGELDFEAAPRRDERLVQIEQTVERAEFETTGDAETQLAAAGHEVAADVLIVEDNADMRKLLAFLVGQEFQVRTARNGREALERVAEKVPDLVLTDVMMPEMSGTELCAALKQREDTRHVPVVLVTSKAEREMKVRGLELGADDYVTKPFHPRELMARVRSLLRLRRLQEELSERNATLEGTNAELGQALAELREAHVQLVQAERLAAVGELAAGVAHEVNNPVNFATNALKTLRRSVEELRQVAMRIAAIDLGDPSRRDAQIAELAKLRDDLELDGLAESLAELVGIATEGLDRTHRLVGDLRDFAAPGDGPRADVNLRRGLASTLQLIRHELRRAGVEVELHVDEALPLVRGDARALNQVFLNLLKNAAEALEGRGGTVGVRIRRIGESIALEVRDDGPGIDPALVPRLFEPFFTTKQAGRGTGLGLSISRRIVTEHGGTIEVESSPGEGACFRVALPAQEEGIAP